MLQQRGLTAEHDILLTQAINSALARVYGWMAGGLLLTAIVATLVAHSGPASAAVSNGWVMLGLFAAQIGLVWTIAARIEKLDPGAALGVFFVYSVLLGATLSVMFQVYKLGDIGLAFGAAAATFTAMAVVGTTTKRDLTQWRPMLLASLFGLLIAMVANLILQSSAVEWAVSVAGVLIFMGLTVLDAQAIKVMTEQAYREGDEQAVSRVGVLGALTLYLDFVNLFLFLLSLMGDDS